MTDLVHSGNDGIVWAAMSTTSAASAPAPGMLRAFDAVTLTELWNSNMNTADDAGNVAKFCLPTVANGRVYLATFSNQLTSASSRTRRP